MTFVFTTDLSEMYLYLKCALYLKTGLLLEQHSAIFKANSTSKQIQLDDADKVLEKTILTISFIFNGMNPM